MAFSSVRMTVLAAALIASSAVPGERIQAQADCGGQDVVDRIDRQNQEMYDELKKENADMLVDGLQGAAIKDASKILKNKLSTAAQRADAYQVYRQSLESFESFQKTFQVTSEDLVKCMQSSSCNLFDFSKRQNQAFRRWIESFLPEGTKSALEHVRKAQSILQKHSLQLAGNATGNMAAAVGAMGRCEQSARQQADPVNTRGRTADKIAQPSSGTGMSGGAKVGLGLVAAGAGAVVVYEAAHLSLSAPDVDTGTGGNSGGSSGFSGTYSVHVTRSCVAGAFPASCVQASVNGSCSPLDFTSTVSGGVARDCGNWLAVSVGSSGAFSGNYAGSTAASGVPVSGAFPQSGSSTAAGSIVSGGSSYSVQIQITKQ